MKKIKKNLKNTHNKSTLQQIFRDTSENKDIKHKTKHS